MSKAKSGGKDHTSVSLDANVNNTIKIKGRDTSLARTPVAKRDEELVDETVVRNNEHQRVQEFDPADLELASTFVQINPSVVARSSDTSVIAPELDPSIVDADQNQDTTVVQSEPDTTVIESD